MSSDWLVEGVVTKPSSFTIAETLERLENVIRSKGLTIFALIDHSGEAERIGLRMQDAKLLIFGSQGWNTVNDRFPSTRSRPTTQSASLERQRRTGTS